MADKLQEITIASAVQGASPGLKGVLGIPSGPGPWPAVVVVHEIFGVDDEMRKQVAHLARLGYLALLPDLYTAGGMRRCVGATFRALRSGTGRAFADIEAARQLLVARDDCSGAVGVIGFCMGGGFALASAASGDGFVAASVNYGMLPHDLDSLERACPVVASYGAKDFSLKGAAAELESTLTKYGVPHDVKEYPDASHAFLNEAAAGPRWARPLLRVGGFVPNPEAAADAWGRIKAFFDVHLVAPTK